MEASEAAKQQLTALITRTHTDLAGMNTGAIFSEMVR